MYIQIAPPTPLPTVAAEIRDNCDVPHWFDVGLVDVDTPHWLPLEPGEERP